MSDDGADRSRVPFGNMRFSVEISGTATTGAVEVVFPEARLGGRSRKAGTATYGPLVLRRGLTRSRDWYDWWDAARRTRRPAVRAVRILLHDQASDGRVGWLLEGAVPVAYHLSPLNALGNEVVIETLELGVRHFEAFSAPADGAAASPARSKRPTARSS